MREALLFLDKKDNRKYNLFLTLKNSEEQRVSIKTIMGKYQYTRKTFYTDLAELKEDVIQVYQEDLLEKTQSDIVLRQGRAPVLSYPMVLFYVYHSRTFQVFDNLVQRETQTFKQLQSTIVCSQSAIYQSLKTLNQGVASLELTFSLGGIEGDERIIRHLLFAVYWAHFGGLSWPFTIAKEELLAVFNMEGFSKQVMTEYERDKCLFWLAITLYRLRKGKTIPLNHGVKENIPKWFRTYLAMGAGGGLSINMEDEHAFLLRVLHLFAPPVYWSNQERLQLKGMIYYQSLDQLVTTIRTKGTWPLNIQLEERLLEHARIKGWGESHCQNLAIQFSKIRYYVEGNLIEWCHWLEPECLPDYLSRYFSFEKEWQELFDLLPKEVASLYALECRQMGLSLCSTIRLRIHAKMGRIEAVRRLLDSYGDDSIEIDQGARQADILLTDLLSEYQAEQALGNLCILYELPLAEAVIISELKRAVSRFRTQQRDNDRLEEKKSI